MFLGRQRRSVTQYHYDDDGRLAWSETIESPEWTDEDRADHLEWQHEQNLICGSCGHPLDETTDNDHRAAWIAEKKVCWSCAARDRATQHGGHEPGAKWVTRKRDPSEGVPTSGEV